jgi:Cu-processing system permease protein
VTAAPVPTAGAAPAGPARGAWLLVARLTVREAVNRRVVLAAAVLSTGFLVLFSVGTHLLRSAEGAMSALAASVLASLGLYAVHFLGAFVALTVTVGAVAGEIDSGALHALLARPLSRRGYILGRWVGLVALVVGYVVLMGSSVLLISATLADHTAASPAGAVALMALEAVLLLTVGLLASTRLSTIASGVTVFCLFATAWIAGIIELIGEVTANEAMTRLGIAVSLLLPSDALWRGASYFSQSPFTQVLMGSRTASDSVPFLGSAPPSPALLAWSALYIVGALLLAMRLFRRRDL